MNDNPITEDWKNIADPALREKAKQKECKKAFYQANKAEVLIRSKAYYKANKDKISIKAKIYREKNQEKILIKKKVYYEANKHISKNQMKIYREKNRKKLLASKIAYANANRHIRKAWLDSNKDKINEYNSNRYKTNIQHKLSKLLRSRLWDALQGDLKSGSAVKDLGCSIEELKICLESKFQEGMSWDNWTSDGWHIDHIKPLASFDLTDRNQLIQACHYTNLQPLWAKDNFSKGDKIT